MVRRALVIAAFVVVILAVSATPALALNVLWSQPVEDGSRLATAAFGPIVAWEVAVDTASEVQAVQYSKDGAGVYGPVTIVPTVEGLEDWFIAGDGDQNVTVVWKAAGVVSVTRVDLGDGSASYEAVTVCTDAAVADLREDEDAAATPVGVAADGVGGVYIWLTATPSASGGDTFLNHVSNAGVVARPIPGLAVPGGTVHGLAVDSAGQAVVLLGAPGRAKIAVQRYNRAVNPVWSKPVSPYSPLFGSLSATTQEPIGIVASAGATIAWREGAKVKTQRFSAAGTRLRLAPASVSMAGAVKLAEDGAGGTYLTGPSGDGVVVRHQLAGGSEAPGSPSALPGLGLVQPQVDAVTANRAGDLTVAYSDAVATGTPGVARVTCLGVWDVASLPPAPLPEPFTAAAPNGAGGAYVLGAGGSDRLLHLAAAGAAVTMRSRSLLVKYGKAVTVAGYYTRAGGEPVPFARVTIRRMSGGSAVPVTSATTTAGGYFQTAIKPAKNTRWTATAGGATREKVLVRVAPKITLSLSNTRAGTRLTEWFRGSVAPGHPGARVLVRKAVGSKWRTVASGRLDKRSRYNIAWRLPYRSATYKVRVVLPEHGDHAEGTSPTATLKVRVKKLKQ